MTRAADATSDDHALAIAERELRAARAITLDPTCDGALAAGHLAVAWEGLARGTWPEGQVPEDSKQWLRPEDRAALPPKLARAVDEVLPAVLAAGARGPFEPGAWAVPREALERHCDALGLVLAPLLAGAVISRLAGPCSVGEQARASFTHFPAALVIGLYGLVLRVLLALIAAALGTIHPTLQVVGVAAGLMFTALVVDLARARTVLDGDRGLHPRTFVRAMTTAAHQPGLCLRSGLLTLLHWGLTLAILLAAVHGLASAWAPWLVRGLALLATFVALWRVAVAVDHGRP